MCLGRRKVRHFCITTTSQIIGAAVAAPLSTPLNSENICPSLAFLVQLTILAILKISYRFKGLCLEITVLNIKYKYSNYLCQYYNFKIHV